ncbi:MAG: serine hydrolase [Planctomycetaceae bacterium]|nr:serine hydrolase [Planctomycetaceae bacterium]
MLARRSFALVLAVLALTTSVTRSTAAEPAWPVPQWQTATPASQGMSAEGVDKVRQWLGTHGSKTGMVIRHGQIVGEWYFNEATPASKYLVYSTSKSFASTAAGVAIAQGKLSLDDNVGRFVPDVKPADKKEITVRQLISMTTGVHNNAKLPTMPNVFSYSMYEAPQDFKPGTKWDYNNTGLALLSPVMKQATGVEPDKTLDEFVFRPIGIQPQDWHWEQREQRTLSYSGLHINARSLARFGLLFLREGRWQDKQVLSSSWVKEATGPSQKLNPEYGYLWWNNTTGKKWPGTPTDAYAALGRYDNSMLIVPSLDLIVIRQVGDDLAYQHKLKIAELWQLACDAVEKK